MAEIKASMVAELRANTGLGMMECKKALVESQGDMAKAEEILRIKSGNKASKLASRTAAEGIVVSLIKDNVGSLVEINCETDFVAKDDSFVAFANEIADVIIDNDVANVQDLSSIKLSSGITVEERRKEIIAKLGENINIRRIYRCKTNNKLVHYLHGKKIGVLLEYDGDNDVVARDIAMHIVASKPICVSKDQVSEDLLDKEKRIYEEQSRQSGKSEEIVQKMVIGKLNKLFSEIVLLNQSFVKDPDLTIEKLLKKNNMKVISFSMFVVGEGIEKKVVDYAAEVAAAAKI